MREGRPFVTASLRQFLSDRLPGLAVPVAFVPVSTLPLTPSGKIDRQALLAESRVTSVATGEPDIVADSGPRSPIERQIAEIWSSVLDVSGVSLRDTFLDLGGNSLLAMQCISRIQSECHVEISLQALLGEESDLKTVVELVERMRKGGQYPDMDVP